MFSFASCDMWSQYRSRSVRNAFKNLSFILSLSSLSVLPVSPGCHGFLTGCLQSPSSQFAPCLLDVGLAIHIASPRSLALIAGGSSTKSEVRDSNPGYTALVPSLWPAEITSDVGGRFCRLLCRSPCCLCKILYLFRFYFANGF